MVLLRDTEQVGDRQCRKGFGVLGHKLTFAVGEKLVELTVGEAPHEPLVLLQPARCQQPVENRPCPPQ